MAPIFQQEEDSIKSLNHVGAGKHNISASLSPNRVKQHKYDPQSPDIGFIDESASSRFNLSTSMNTTKKSGVSSSSSVERYIPKRVVLAWKHLSIRKEKKSMLKKAISSMAMKCAQKPVAESIVDNVAGLVAPGEILAIMGPRCTLFLI